MWCCLHVEALPPSTVDGAPSHPFSAHPPLPTHPLGPSFPRSCCDFLREGLCVFWLNDSLHIPSPALLPFGCTSALFLLLAPGALFSWHSVSSSASSASSARTPARPSLAGLTALHFPPADTLPKASVTCENSFQTCLLETGRQMRDFFIKVRHSREASRKSSESPPGPPSAQSWRGGWASGKARTKCSGLLPLPF